MFRSSVEMSFGIKIGNTGPAKMGLDSVPFLVTSSYMQLPSGELPYEIWRRDPKNNPTVTTGMEKTGPRAVLDKLGVIARSYSTIEWASGLYIFTALNLFQIALTTGLEYLSRSLAIIMTNSVYGLYNKVKDTLDDELEVNLFFDKPIVRALKPVAKFLGKAVTAIILSPFWCIGQTLSFVGDVLSYTRQFIDSGIHLFNPIWWGNKLYEKVTGVSTETPSFGCVVKTFAASTLKLLPAAGSIAASVLSVGLLTPLTVLAKIAIGIYAGGIVASISKLFSSYVTVKTGESLNKAPKPADERGKKIKIVRGGSTATAAKKFWQRKKGIELQEAKNEVPKVSHSLSGKSVFTHRHDDTSTETDGDTKQPPNPQSSQRH